VLSSRLLAQYIVGDLVHHLLAVALLEVVVPSSAVPGHPLHALGLLRNLPPTLRLTVEVYLVNLSPSSPAGVVDRV